MRKLETCLQEVRGATVSDNVPFELVSDVERALEAGVIRSWTPDLAPLLERLKRVAKRRGSDHYAHVGRESRLASLLLILALFLAKQRGTAARFVPQRHVARYFAFYPPLDTLVVVEDVLEVFRKLKAVEVNGSWWRLSRVEPRSHKGRTSVFFKRSAGCRPGGGA